MKQCATTIDESSQHVRPILTKRLTLEGSTMRNGNPPLVYSPVRHRYSLAAKKIAERNAFILDVGGYKSRRKHLSSHFRRLLYYSVNVGPAWYSNDEPHIIYNGIDMPFCDAAFPYVISIDTLEHIHITRRKRLLDEMVRVAEKQVVVVVPISKGGIIDEEYLFLLSEKHDINPMPSLMEHLKYGLPTVDELIQYANNYSFRITFASPRYVYWSFQMAMLINQITIGSQAEALNKKIQEAMERIFEPEEDNLDQFDAYRAILTIEKS